MQGPLENFKVSDMQHQTAQLNTDKCVYLRQFILNFQMYWQKQDFEAPN